MLQFDQFVGQQAQGPFRLSFRGGAASQGKKVRFGLAVQFALVPACGRLGPQGYFKTFFDKALAHTGHRGRMHLQRLTNGFIAPGRSFGAAIGLQQNAGMEQSAGRGFAAPNHLGKGGLLFRRQSDNVLLPGEGFARKAALANCFLLGYPAPLHTAHYP